MIRTFASIIPDGFSQGERLRRLAIVLSARSCVTKLWGQLKGASRYGSSKTSRVCRPPRAVSAVGDSVLYHSLLGLASGERFGSTCVKCPFSSNCLRLPRFVNARRLLRTAQPFFRRLSDLPTL